MACDKDISNVCAENTFSTCVDYEGNLGENTKITDSCVTQHDVNEDLYTITDEIIDNLDTENLKNTCLVYPQVDNKIIPYSVFSVHNTEICDLKDRVLGLENFDYANLDITPFNLDFVCLQDPCNNEITTLKPLLQNIINKSCENSMSGGDSNYVSRVTLEEGNLLDFNGIGSAFSGVVDLSGLVITSLSSGDNVQISGVGSNSDPFVISSSLLLGNTDAPNASNGTNVITAESKQISAYDNDLVFADVNSGNNVTTVLRLSDRVNNALSNNNQNLQQVTNNGNSTTNDIIVSGTEYQQRGIKVNNSEYDIYFSNDAGFRFSDNGNTPNIVTIQKSNIDTAVSLQVPNTPNERIIPVSVNGEFADVSGNISLILPNSASGLEAIDEGNGIGWRLIGRNPTNYGNIGFNSVDLSRSDAPNFNFSGPLAENSLTIGINSSTNSNNSFVGGRDSFIDVSNPAFGENFVFGNNSRIVESAGSFALSGGQIFSSSQSFVFGTNSTAQNGGKMAVGFDANAIANQSIALGNDVTANGDYSAAIGRLLTTQSEHEIAFGMYNTEVAGTPDDFVLSDRAFSVGIGDNQLGSGPIGRRDGISIFKSGLVLFPELTNTLIDGASDDVAVTKGWVNAQSFGGGSSTALATTYDNSDSGLTATNVKEALDELANIDSSLSLASSNTTNFNAVAAHVGGMNDIDSASNVTVTIQENATEDIPVGSVLTYNQINDGRLIVAYSGSASGDAGQTYKKGDVLTLWHKSLDNWVILNQPHALDSQTEGEPTGSDQVLNLVSLTQAEYDAGTPVSTTLYNIIP